MCSSTYASRNSLSSRLWMIWLRREVMRCDMGTRLSDLRFPLLACCCGRTRFDAASPLFGAHENRHLASFGAVTEQRPILDVAHFEPDLVDSVPFVAGHRAGLVSPLFLLQNLQILDAGMEFRPRPGWKR